MSLIESDYDRDPELYQVSEKSTWEHIAEAKRLFIEANVDPALAPEVRPQIAASWKRCKEQNILPDKNNLSIALTDAEFDQIIKQHADLIDVSRPLLSVTDNLAISDEYTFELCVADGASLLQTGNLNLHEYVASNSIFNESTMGTNAHSLCMQHKMPFMILGPEHYCDSLTNLAAIAAPIFNRSNEVIAALLLTQPLRSSPWSQDYQRLLAHTMGLITSIALAIEYQMEYRSAYTLLTDAEHEMDSARLASEHAYHLLQTTVETSSEGIVVVDNNGVINYMSPEAGHLLSTTIDSAYGKPIAEFLGLTWPEEFKPYIAARNGKSFARGAHSYILRGVPVLDAETGEDEGIVFKMQAVERTLADSKHRSVGDIASIGFENILGDSHAIGSAVKTAQRFATAPENILLTGETGTGKEYFAQALHNASRPNGPFMSINCAAIPPRLIESELFGYESGSFTGADRAGKPGKFELAHGGTIFLDEISDMELELQSTLLRVLENKRVMRLGGSSYKQVDFRVIAATNRDLSEMVAAKTFREDLFYRLSVLSIKLPPLRERANDTILLAKYYLNECHRKDSGGPRVFSPLTLEAIQNYPWPGNVRQLKNAVFAAYYTAQGVQIIPSDLPDYVTNSIASPKVAIADSTAANTAAATNTNDNGIVLPRLSKQEAEAAAIRDALQRSGNNVVAAASMLNISKATLYRKLKDYRIAK